MEPSDKQPTPALAAPGQRRAGLHLLAFLILAVIVATTLAFDLRRAYHDTLNHWEVLFSNSASDRITLVTLWLNQRKTDTELIAENPATASLLTDGATNQAAANRAVVEREMERMTHFDRFLAGVVLDRDCRVVARV